MGVAAAMRVLAVSLLLAVGGLPTGSAAGAVSRCLIAFSRNDNGTNLALYDRASGRVRDLTYSGGDDTAPAWSRDGNQVAFVRSSAGYSHIWIANLADDERQLTDGRTFDFGPAWSPDGRRIAFSRDGAIYVVDVKSRRTARLTPIGQTSTYLSWSPDGRKLAYQTLQGIKLFDLRTHRTTLAKANASNPQYLPSGLLTYRLGNTFHAGRRSLTISFAGHGQWNSSATSLVFTSFVDPQLTSPPPADLYVERVGAVHPRHLYVSDFAGDPTWRPGC